MQTTQAGFEAQVRTTLETKALIRQLEAAARRYLRLKFGENIPNRFPHGHVAEGIVSKYGIDEKEKAIRCMEYLLNQVLSTGQVSEAYDPCDATLDAWKLLKVFLENNTEFDFTREPNEEFRQGLHLVESKATG